MSVRRRATTPTLSVALAVLLVGACAPSSPAPTASGTASPARTSGADTEVRGRVDGAAVLEAGGRPFQLVVPPGHDLTRPVPLVLVLHGFGADPAGVDELLGLRAEAERRDVLYALPQGTEDAVGRLFWNATDACCDLEDSGVDDVRYLAQVVDTVEDRYAVDPAHVAVVGHSNGGFMAYRAACALSGRVRSVVSVAGVMPRDEGTCAPSSPVTAVGVHGTSDPVVAHGGGSLFGTRTPSAADSTAAWARLDGCSRVPDVTPAALDLETSIDGAETSVAAYPGCDDGARAELWTVDGGTHAPAFGGTFATAVLDVVTGG